MTQSNALEKSMKRPFGTFHPSKHEEQNGSVSVTLRSQIPVLPLRKYLIIMVLIWFKRFFYSESSFRYRNVTKIKMRIFPSMILIEIKYHVFRKLRLFQLVLLLLNFNMWIWSSNGKTRSYSWMNIPFIHGNQNIAFLFLRVSSID